MQVSFQLASLAPAHDSDHDFVSHLATKAEIQRDSRLEQGISSFQRDETDDKAWMAKQATDSQRWVLEAFCSPTSTIGEDGKAFGHNVLRLTKDVNLLTEEGQRLADSVINIADHPVLWGALPCTAWCRWAPLNMSRGNPRTV